MYLWKKWKIATVTSNVPLPDRAAMIRRFMNEIDHKTGEFYPPEARENTIQGPIRILAAGYNLHRSRVVVLTEPAIKHTNEQQAAMRVRRISQTATKTWVLRLVTQESSLETMILKAQDAASDATELAMSYISTTED